MHRIASYQSTAMAHLVAAYLREHGVMTGVIDATMSAVTNIMGGARSRGGYELMIATKRDEELALELIAQLKENPPTIDPDWEDDIAPDLTLLDKSLLPDCPGCKWPVSVARPLGPCQRCGVAYDLLEMIFERHGPEALAACYETEAPMAGLSDQQVCEIAIDCPGCSYPLDGLGVRGSCPECGAGFDRRALFNGLLGY